MTEPVLSVHGLQVAYGKVDAVHGIDLQVRAGEIVTVIGPNGAGKSSLLNAIAGALPVSGSARGRVLLDGADIGGLPVDRRVALGMSLVPEKRELFASMSIDDNLLLGSYRRYRAREANYADQREVVYRLFPRLLERRTQAAGTLSGGERQMLAVGRALMAKPRLLLLDEPSLGLAPLITREIYRILLQLRETGVAILLVEQNARAALRAADHALVLELGHVTLAGPAASVAQHPTVVDAYLGLGARAE